MKRRAFIALLGGAAIWPLRLRAQQARTPTVGLLILTNPEPYWTFVRDGFREAGYVDGRSIKLEFRAAHGDQAALVEQAAELVHAKSDVIIAIQTAAVEAAMRATSEIPIVMVSGAPVETGVVQSLSRPGGNVTGVSTTVPEVAAKALETMREILPSLRRVAVLVNGRDRVFGDALLAHVEAAARAMAIEVHPIVVRMPEEVPPVFASLGREGVQAVIVQPSLPRGQAIELALQHRLPTISPNLGWAEAGALMSYGPDLRDVCRKAAAYADRILKGAKAGDLPIEQPTKFELAINLKTARALDIDVPPMILARDAKLIE